jgi:hypothetical protein
LALNIKPYRVSTINSQPASAREGDGPSSRPSPEGSGDARLTCKLTHVAHSHS